MKVCLIRINQQIQLRRIRSFFGLHWRLKSLFNAVDIWCFLIIFIGGSLPDDASLWLWSFGIKRRANWILNRESDVHTDRFYTCGWNSVVISRKCFNCEWNWMEVGRSLVKYSRWKQYAEKGGTKRAKRCSPSSDQFICPESREYSTFRSRFATMAVSPVTVSYQ